MTILTEKDLAKRLNLSSWTIRRMRIQEGMPHFYVGKRIFYNLDHVFAWIDSKSSGTVAIDPPVVINNQYGQIRKIT